MSSARELAAERERTREVHRDLTQALLYSGQHGGDVITLTRDQVSMVLQRLAVHISWRWCDAVTDDDLGRLLDDVHRIVDGLDGVKALTVEGGRPVRQVFAPALSAGVEFAWVRLQAQLRAAENAGATTAIVHVANLRAVLDAVAQQMDQP